MKKPDLQLLAKWLDPATVAALESRRRKKKEFHRRRKLATLQTVWLMLAVSLDTRQSSLHDILRLATGQLGIQFSVSVAAFCKARARFSPRGVDIALSRFMLCMKARESGAGKVGRPRYTERKRGCHEPSFIRYH